MRVIGIQDIDVKNEKGEYHGKKFYCTDDSNPNVNGLSVETFVCSNKLLDSLKRVITLDDEVMPIYPKESKSVRTVLFLE